jgi:hypothetical protein
MFIDDGSYIWSTADIFESALKACPVQSMKEPEIVKTGRLYREEGCANDRNMAGAAWRDAI